MPKMKMKAAVFVEPGRIVLEEKPVPDVGPLDALVRVTTTTICGTDIHILKGEYPVERGLTIGHEPVGVIEKLGSAVTGYREGQRVIAGAITPSGHSAACLCGCWSQDGAGTKHGFKAVGGWKFGNRIDGCQAEYVRVPVAMANLAPVPDGLTDEQVRCRVRAGTDRALRNRGRQIARRDHNYCRGERSGPTGGVASARCRPRCDRRGRTRSPTSGAAGL